MLRSVRVGIDNVAERRVYLILDCEAQPHLPARHCLGGFHQTGGEMPSDPLTKEGIRHLDFQSVTITAQAEMDFLTKPEAKSKLAEPLGHCGPKRRLQGQVIGWRTGNSIVYLARMCHHCSVPHALVRVGIRVRAWR